MTVRRFVLLAVVVAVTASGCSTAKSVIGVPNTGDPSVTIKSAETLVDLRRTTGLKPSKTGYFSAKPPRERVRELLRFYGIANLEGQGS